MSLPAMFPSAMSPTSQVSTLVDLPKKYFFRISCEKWSLPSFPTYAHNFWVIDTQNVTSVYIKGLENIVNQKEVALELEEKKKHVRH